MLRRRATVQHTPEGWVATLVGGSVSKPMDWRSAYTLADTHTRHALAYWADRGVEPCS